MTSFGPELKRERELRGITLQEISETTKINIRFIRALEEDHFDMLPGKFFTRGIIRSYVGYLGLDENDVLNQYNEFMQKKVPPIEEDDQNSEEVEPTRFKFRRIFIFLGLILLIGVPVILYLNYTKKETTPISIPEKKSEKIIPSKPVEIPKPAIQSEPQEQGLLLEISFIQQTWIRLHADGELIFEGIKEENEQFRVEAQKEVLMYVGNAGGFTFNLNGKPGKTLGVPGEVISNIFITLENYEQFIVENNKPSSII